MPARSGRGPYATSGILDLRRALSHLHKQDLPKDVWAPDILFFKDELASQDELLIAAAEKIDLLVEPDPPLEVRVPKSPLFVRNGIDLTLPDRVAYQGLVQELEAITEGRLSPKAYASRPDTGSAGRRQQGAVQRWLAFRRDARAALEHCRGWMIRTDITRYFDFIDHRRLFDLLSESGVPTGHVQVLRAMLGAWTYGSGRGLPQGPDASRKLGNFYLVELDESLLAIPGVEYFRYMDDMIVISSSRARAVAALQLIGDTCYRHGLPLSTQKTEALPYDRAMTELAGEDLRSAPAGYGEDADEDDPEQDPEYLLGVFRQAVRASGQLNQRKAKYSLIRLHRLAADAAVDLTLKRLEDLGPVAKEAARYLSHWIGDQKVAQRMAIYLGDDDRNTSDFVSAWLLAAALESPMACDASLVAVARRFLQNLNSAPYLRAIAANVTVLSGRTSDADAIERIALSEHNPVVVRGAIVATYRGGRLTKALQAKLRRRQGFGATLDYLQGRNELPSVLFRDRSAAIHR